MQQKLSTTQDSFTRRRLVLEIEFGKNSLKKSLNPIQATLRDIILLKAHWDSIYQKMTEKEIEHSETEYWILRL